MIILYGIGLDVLALAVVLVFGAFYFRASRHDGYEDGYYEGRADRAQAELAGRTHGRHARTQPRTAPARNPDTGTWHLPIPGPSRPQAGRTSEPGTVTFARLDKPATTGEMAAVTDQYLADMAVQEEQFRLGLAT